MNRNSVYFTAARQVEVRPEPVAALKAGTVLVQTLCSAISSGTELLIYRGQAPQELEADATITALSGSLAFPLKYGYSAVGRVVECGAGVDPSWRGKRVFAFNPHETYFVAEPDSLIPLPDDISDDDAVFLPNMETAVNFLQDGAPLVGERVAVLGQGIVGLLTTQLLGRIPLDALVTCERFPLRRKLSQLAGAQECVAPENCAALTDFDLTYELTGVPEALNQAIACTGFEGRVVIGSWYGAKQASLQLGGRFHRSRIRLISSQVSSLSPNLNARWTKGRRLQTALGLLQQLKPARFITQRFRLDQAAQAYGLLDEYPEQAVQVVFTYEA